MTKSQIIYGFHAVNALLAMRAKCVQRIYLLRNRHDQRVQRIIEQANKHQIVLEYASRETLNEMIANDQHQGVVAVCVNLPDYHESDLLQLLTTIDHPPLLLILDGIQDPHNLGACMRTANAMGVDAVIATRDRAVGLTPVARKVASGADILTPFIQITNLARTLRALKEQGIWLVGTAGEAEVRIQEIDLTGPIAIIVGSEGQGLRRLTREICDYLARIELYGSVDSLNVSVATGMCLYEVRRQRVGN